MFIGGIFDGADVEEQAKGDDPPKPPSVIEVLKYVHTKTSNIFFFRKQIFV